MQKTITLTLFLFLIAHNNFAQYQIEKPIKNKMEWFADAKLGIFIHWGIYAVDGVSESWSFYNNYLSHENYMKQLTGFTATKYDPALWVKLIEESGAKYTVITTKHHDGVSLWDTKAKNAITTLKSSASKKDLLTPFINEVKKSNLKTGIYFSLPDWSYSNYDVFTKNRKRYNISKDPERWHIFTNYFQTQLKELNEQYHPDLFWFDGDWEHNEEEWQSNKVIDFLKVSNPNLIINSRLNGKGDYETPEQGIPVIAPKNPYWELCYTMNDSWGYQPSDTKYKSSNMIIRTLVDCIGNGGNLLLNISPKADGTIPSAQIDILKGLGRWTKKHAQSIYQTRAGIQEGHFEGKTTLSKDKKTLFLFLESHQENIFLTGLKSQVKSVRVVGMPQNKLAFVKKNSNTLFINTPKNLFDKDVTVLAIELFDAIQLAEVDFAIKSLDEIINHTEKPSISKYLQIVNQLQEGNQLFKNTNLREDGEDFKSPNINDPSAFKWIKKHAEALYETGKGLPNGHFIGSSLLSKDRKTIYLFINGKPSGPIALKGIKNDIARVRVVGNGRIINAQTFNQLYWSSVPGITYISIPNECLDKNLTVIAVLLKSELALYREQVGAIESN